MTNYADEKKIGNNSIQLTTEISDSAEVSVVIYLLEIITKVGKHFPILFLSLASLQLLLAANDFLANSIEFGILNSLFAASSFIFLVQMHQMKRNYPSLSSKYQNNSRSVTDPKECNEEKWK
jgi:hypothetical protein